MMRKRTKIEKEKIRKAVRLLFDAQKSNIDVDYEEHQAGYMSLSILNILEMEDQVVNSDPELMKLLYKLELSNTSTRDLYPAIAEVLGMMFSNAQKAYS